MAAGRGGGIGPACSGGLPEAAPAGAPLHGRATARSYFAGDGPGQRGLYEDDRLRAGELEGPRPFLRHFGANDAAGFGGVCALTPVSETGSGSEKDIARRRCHCISTTRTGSRRTRRCSTGPCSGISPAGSSRGTAVFRRIERGRNRRGAARLCHHRHARLATGQGLVGARTEKARFECRRNDRNELNNSITKRGSAIRGSAPRFSLKR